jgi:hypothetical protein
MKNGRVALPDRGGERPARRRPLLQVCRRAIGGFCRTCAQLRATARNLAVLSDGLRPWLLIPFRGVEADLDARSVLPMAGNLQDPHKQRILAIAATCPRSLPYRAPSVSELYRALMRRGAASATAQRILLSRRRTAPAWCAGFGGAQTVATSGRPVQSARR